MGAAGGADAWWWQAEPTPELRWPLNIQVYDQMRRQDAQVISVLRAVKLPVRRTKWSIDQGAASDEVARFVADNLGLPLAGANQQEQLARTRDRFSWKDHLRHALLMLEFGHMPFEQVYRIADDGRAWIRKLAPRMPQTLSEINVAVDGGLESIRQYAAAGSRVEPPKIPVDRLVMYVHEREGGNWRGQSLLRSAYKDWLLKDRLLRVDTATIERNGMGVPVYEGSEEQAGADKESGLALATSIRAGQSAGGYIPAGAKLTLKGVEGELPKALDSIRYHDEQIAKSVLAHFMNLGQATGTGSYALGESFLDFFVASLQAVAEDIADIATQHIVEDLVDINFGPTAPAPRITFQEIGSRSQVTAQAIALLVNSGVLLREPALERYIRETYGIPDKEPLPGQTTPPGGN
ncbi:MAG: DUF935 family protein [Nocardioidaceae bacterium]|nr:DUF935 family protein [Nocardioidaceae bacterium]